jgi:cysteine desulfurase
MKKIYFDNAASTPVDERVLEEMKPYFSEKFGNASSLHDFGIEAKEALERARERLSEVLQCEPEEIYFTSGGTESNNLALRGVMEANKDKGNHLIVSAVEHPCIMQTAKYLESKGFKVTYLPVDEFGRVAFDDLKKAVTKKTVLVSIMTANHEVGSYNNLDVLADFCAGEDIFFHTDACQAFGKLPILPHALDIDLMTFSAHKINGPKGIGALFIRKGVPLDPIIFGGGHENGLRSGTENVAGAVGFAKAAELAIESHNQESERLTKLRDKLIEGVLKIPETRLNGHPTSRLFNNANFSFKYIEGEALLMRLNGRGIAISTGSACSSKSLQASHVLLAMGLDPVQAHGSLRVSLGRFNTEEEVDYFLKVLPEEVEKLRALSPLRE